MTQENEQEEYLDNPKEETEKLDFTKPDFEFIPQGNHEFRQQGPYIICYSCILQHAVWIGMEKLMVGIDKGGQPILKMRSEVSKLKPSNQLTS